MRLDFEYRTFRIFQFFNLASFDRAKKRQLRFELGGDFEGELMNGLYKRARCQLKRVLNGLN